MPPQPPPCLLLRPRLIYPPPAISHSIHKPTIRPLSISSKPKHNKTSPLLLTQRHNRRPAFPHNNVLLPCTALRYYQNKHLPKKRWWQKLKNNFERNEFLRRQGERAAKHSIRNQAMDEQQKENQRKNVASQLKEKAVEMDDFGILEGTPIILTKFDWPSLIREPKRRLKMELRLLYKKFEERIQFLYFIAVRCYGYGIRNTLSQRLGRFEAKQAALVLHFQMNQALADGSTDALAKVTFTGLKNELRTLIGQRPPGTSYLWTRDAPRASLISHRVTRMPAEYADGTTTGVFLRQAVVRIVSAQSIVEQRREDLAYADVDAEKTGLEDREPRTEAAELCDELFVVQQMIKGAEVQPWKAWGTTQETTMAGWAAVVDPAGAVERREAAMTKRWSARDADQQQPS